MSTGMERRKNTEYTKWQSREDLATNQLGEKKIPMFPAPAARGRGAGMLVYRFEYHDRWCELPSSGSAYNSEGKLTTWATCPDDGSHRALAPESRKRSVSHSHPSLWFADKVDSPVASTDNWSFPLLLSQVMSLSKIITTFRLSS